MDHRFAVLAHVPDLSDLVRVLDALLLVAALQPRARVRFVDLAGDIIEVVRRRQHDRLLS